MKLFLFGGSGLIGRALLASPRLQEYDLFVISRHPGTRIGEGKSTILPYDNDLLSAQFKGDYGIINLAGAGIGDKLWTNRRKKLILDSRVKAGEYISALVNAAEQKPRFIIQASAVGFYGPRGDELLDEDSSMGKGFLPEVTDKWERSIALDEPDTVRVVYVRTGLVLSEKGGFLAPSLKLFKLFAGGHFGNGKQWMPWIHMEDEVRAIVFLIHQQSAKGAFNLVAPNPVRGKDLFKTLGRVLKRPSWLPAPTFVLKMIPNGFGEELLLTSQNVKPARLLKLGYDFRFQELEKALSDLFNHE
jgi:uncharacterized protein (TIGR01777 family)